MFIRIFKSWPECQKCHKVQSPYEFLDPIKRAPTGTCLSCRYRKNPPGSRGRQSKRQRELQDRVPLSAFELARKKWI